MKLNQLLVTTGLAVAFGVGMASLSHAQESSAGTEGSVDETLVIVSDEPDPITRRCVQPTAGASQVAIDAFKANPSGLLAQNPLGGLALSNEVRSLAASDVDTVPLILALEGQATERQVRAIGAGLARAAAICVATNPNLAEEIQLAVAGSDNENLVTAFLTGAGNQDTAGIGGGAAGGGTAGGGGAGGGAGGIGGSPAGGSTNIAGTGVANSGGTTGGAGRGFVFGGGDDGDDGDDAVSPVN